MRIFRRFRKGDGGDGLACQEVVELVTAYLEDAMDPGERKRFEDHLAECDGCDTYVEQMRQILAASGRLEPEQLPADLLAHLEIAFRGWRPSSSP